MGELKHSMERMAGLKRPTKAQEARRARKRKLTPLDDAEIAEIESDVGAPVLDAKTRKRRRTFAKVADSLLGGSSGGLGG